MEYCLVAERYLPSFIDILKKLFSFIAVTLFGNACSETDLPRESSRERINHQAERMLSEYGNAVLRLAYSYLHNTDDAEEVLQDTLVQFLRTSPALNAKEHEKAWLLHVAANLSKNRIKYNAIRQTDELMEELVAENRDDLSFVWEAVKTLPDNYREVVHLFYYEGYPTAQIAKILGMKETTVRSNLSRGREKLKTVLKEAYDFE
ncbi:RNA polymerase sigma factor [Diplocloster modestus]